VAEEFAIDPKSRRSVERVTLNGEDVTSRCYMIDEDAQLVGLYVRDEQGRLILREDRRPKTALVYGVVEVTRKGSNDQMAVSAE
jgi:hypothetical protein